MAEKFNRARKTLKIRHATLQPLTAYHAPIIILPHRCHVHKVPTCPPAVRILPFPSVTNRHLTMRVCTYIHYIVRIGIFDVR